MAGGGEGGLHGFYLPRGWGYPSSYGTLHGVRPQGLPNCFQTAQTEGGRVETRRKGLGFEWGGDSVFDYQQPGEGGRRRPQTSLQSRYLRSRFLFGPHAPSLPGAVLGRGKQDLEPHLAFTFLGGYNPRLNGEDSSLFLFFLFFFFLFLFLEGSASDCLEHMLLPPSFLQPPATESPLFCIYHFPSPFFIKGPGVAAANQRSASIL